VEIDRYTLIANELVGPVSPSELVSTDGPSELVSTDGPSNELPDEFTQLHDVSGRSESVALRQTTRELSEFFIIAFEIVLISVCLIAFIVHIWNHSGFVTSTIANDSVLEFFIYAAATVLFTGLVTFLGQLEFYPDNDTTVSGRLTLIISLLIACIMICLLNYASNYSWFSLTSMCRYVPILFILGATYIFIFSSGWRWAHDVDYSFGIDFCALATFVIAAGILGPPALFGLLKLTCWWISKI